MSSDATRARTLVEARFEVPAIEATHRGQWVWAMTKIKGVRHASLDATMVMLAGHNGYLWIRGTRAGIERVTDFLEQNGLLLGGPFEGDDR